MIIKTPSGRSLNELRQQLHQQLWQPKHGGFGPWSAKKVQQSVGKLKIRRKNHRADEANFGKTSKIVWPTELLIEVLWKWLWSLWQALQQPESASPRNRSSATARSLSVIWVEPLATGAQPKNADSLKDWLCYDGWYFGRSFNVNRLKSCQN